jgi:hypothetical protein
MMMILKMVKRKITMKKRVIMMKRRKNKRNPRLKLTTLIMKSRKCRSLFLQLELSSPNMMNMDFLRMMDLITSSLL